MILYVYKNYLIPTLNPVPLTTNNFFELPTLILTHSYSTWYLFDYDLLAICQALCQDSCTKSTWKSSKKFWKLVLLIFILLFFYLSKWNQELWSILSQFFFMLVSQININPRFKKSNPGYWVNEILLCLT